MIYDFRLMTRADIPMIDAWLQTPGPQQWWVDPEGNVSVDADEIGHPGVSMWIVSHDGQPFAYMQDWDVHAWPDHYFVDRAPGVRGIDQFIGIPAMLGVGHGHRFIRQRVEALLASGAPEIVVDPAPANLRAVAAYQKAGFTTYGEHNSSQWGHVLLMSCTS